MGAPLDPTIGFRRQLQNKLDLRKTKYIVTDDKPDEWGLSIRRKNATGASVWYAADRGEVTLGLMKPETRARVPEGETPEGARFHTSRTGWYLYSLPAPVMSLDKPFHGQEGADVLVDRIKDLFDWYADIVDRSN